MRHGAFILAIAGVLGAVTGCAHEPSQPPAAPQPTKFVVFFDFSSAALLSPETQGVISEAARAAHDNNLAHVIVIGHADGIGSPADNEILSKRRAKAVEAVLIADGVPRDSITAIGSGSHDDFAKTGSDVREPVNRRAVIRLDD